MSGRAFQPVDSVFKSLWTSIKKPFWQQINDYEATPLNTFSRIRVFIFLLQRFQKFVALSNF